VNADGAFKLTCCAWKSGALLKETRTMPIVEVSRKDPFWGAKAQDDGTLLGQNVLGQLLMELRAEVNAGAARHLMSWAQKPPMHWSSGSQHICVALQASSMFEQLGGGPRS
jgi:hypothetical protein